PSLSSGPHTEVRHRIGRRTGELQRFREVGLAVGRRAVVGLQALVAHLVARARAVVQGEEGTLEVRDGARRRSREQGCVSHGFSLLGTANLVVKQGALAALSL